MRTMRRKGKRNKNRIHDPRHTIMRGSTARFWMKMTIMMTVVDRNKPRRSNT